MYYTPHSSSQLAKNVFQAVGQAFSLPPPFKRRFGCGHAARWGRPSACSRLLAGFPRSAQHRKAAVKHRLPLLFLLGALCVQAALITSVPSGGTPTTFAGGSTCTGGPDAGFTIAVVTNPVCWNVSTYFGFSSNGTWNNPTPGFAFIGANSSTAAFTIDLGGLYAAVGGFMNYNAPVSSPGPTISAIAADGVTVLESYDLSVSAPISTPGGSDAGAFRGISRPSADIRFFELADSFIAIHDITLASTTSAAPEPSTFVLLGTALAIAIAWGRMASCARVADPRKARADRQSSRRV
jgi:hypothetical protein